MRAMRLLRRKTVICCWKRSKGKKDLLQDIRNRFYDLPVVLCTAYDTFKEDMKSIAADYYVIKSFDLSELKSKIAMALDAGVQDRE